MKVQNIKTGKEEKLKAGIDLDEIVKEVKKLARKEDVFIFRERIAWNQYILRVWTSSPTKAESEHIFDIQEVGRKNLAKLGKLVGSKPRDPKIKKPKP